MTSSLTILCVWRTLHLLGALLALDTARAQQGMAMHTARIEASEFGPLLCGTQYAATRQKDHGKDRWYCRDW